MPYHSPLRYPGGKRRLAAVVARLLEENGLRNVNYAESYAGGAAVALALLFGEYASTIHINDLSRPVYAFWHVVLHDSPDLCRRIGSVKVTMREWHRQRAVYENRDAADLSDLGFSTLFLNRTNRSGIVAGGVIGGKSQDGAWPIDARFNKTELITRIQRIARYRTRIHLYGLDALQFTEQALPSLGPNAFVFYDPPYIENGEDLYLNEYDIDGHRSLAKRVLKLKVPWIVTYDRAAVRRRLYPAQRRMAYGLSYSANGRYEGREVMFLSDRLKVPREWASHQLVSLSQSDSRFPVYGRMENVRASANVKEA